MFSPQFASLRGWFKMVALLIGNGVERGVLCWLGTDLDEVAHFLAVGTGAAGCRIFPTVAYGPHAISSGPLLNMNGSGLHYIVDSGQRCYRNEIAQPRWLRLFLM